MTPCGCDATYAATSASISALRRSLGSTTAQPRFVLDEPVWMPGSSLSVTTAFGSSPLLHATSGRNRSAAALTRSFDLVILILLRLEMALGERVGALHTRKSFLYKEPAATRVANGLTRKLCELADDTCRQLAHVATQGGTGWCHVTS